MMADHAPEFWIVRAGTARPARMTDRGIAEHRMEAGRMAWRLLPYNASNPKRFPDRAAAEKYAATLAKRRAA